MKFKKGTILFRKLSFVCVILATFSVSFAAENGNNTNAFNKYMSPEGGINPMSGTVALQKDIGSISVGQVKADFSIKYSGNVFEEAKKVTMRSKVALLV